MDKPKPLFLKPTPKTSLVLKFIKKWKKKKKRRVYKKKRKFRRRLRTLKEEDVIHYTNISFLCQFISKQGKILLRRVNRLNFQQQGLVERAIKQARILCLVSFHEKNKLIEKQKMEKQKIAKQKMAKHKKYKKQVNKNQGIVKKKPLKGKDQKPMQKKKPHDMVQQPNKRTLKGRDVWINPNLKRNPPKK